MIIENVRIAMIGLQSNRLRSLLTMVGITIGVAAVILLISMGQAVQIYVSDQINSLGSNLIIAFPAQDEDGKFTAFTTDEVTALSDHFRVPGINIVMPQYNVNENVVYEGRQFSINIQGVTTDYPTMRNRQVVQGRFFTSAEQSTSARVAVIGQTTAERLFDNVSSSIGKSVRVRNVRFTIIGVLNLAGSGGGPGGNSDDTLMIPISTAQTRLSRDRSITGAMPVSMIYMQANSSETEAVDATVTQVENVLREVRELKSDEANNFRVFSQQSILDTLSVITGLLTVFLGVIAGISLLVGGIGVMNIMMVTVTERTREIGLRKAVGAQKSAILFQFLVESLALALIGGALGIAAAFGLVAAGGALFPTITLAVQSSSVLLATGVSAAVGIFFGIYPAQRAASLNPIDALRYE